MFFEIVILQAASADCPTFDLFNLEYEWRWELQRSNKQLSLKEDFTLVLSDTLVNMRLQAPNQLMEALPNQFKTLWETGCASYSSDYDGPETVAVNNTSVCDRSMNKIKSQTLASRN